MKGVLVKVIATGKGNTLILTETSVNGTSELHLYQANEQGTVIRLNEVKEEE